MTLKKIIFTSLIAISLFIVLPVKYTPLTCGPSAPGLQDCRMEKGQNIYEPLALGYKEYRQQNFAGLPSLPDGLGISKTSIFVNLFATILLTYLIMRLLSKKLT